MAQENGGSCSRTARRGITLRDCSRWRLAARTILLAVVTISVLGCPGCCSLDFRPIPKPLPAPQQAAANGAWQAWQPQFTSGAFGFALAGRPYFMVNVAATGQPARCLLVSYDATANTWKRSALPRCGAADGLIPEAPPDAETRTAAMWLNESGVITTDGGSTWVPMQPMQPGTTGGTYHFNSALDPKTKQPAFWRAMVARHITADALAYRRAPSGNWRRITEWGFSGLPLKRPNVAESGSRIILWQSPTGVYLYRPQELLNKWAAVPLAGAGETLLRLAFAPASEDLLVQLRDPSTTKSSLCRFVATNATPYWRREVCAELPALNSPASIRYFTRERFLVVSGRAAVLTSDAGRTFTPTLPTGPAELVANVVTYTDQRAIGVIQSTAGAAPRFVRSDDGGSTWKNM